MILSQSTCPNVIVFNKLYPAVEWLLLMQASYAIKAKIILYQLN